MKRISLFLGTNLLVTTTLSLIGYFVLSAMGYDPRSYAGLLVMSIIFGFAGSLISLMMSKSSAKRAVNAQVITTPKNEEEKWLVDVISRQALNLKIKMPEVAIYYADEMNAFATGPTRNNSLVAVSSGLLKQMTRDEVEAVLAHEMSHVNNGDMVTMTLLQGLVNTFVIFLSRIIANIAVNYLSRNDGNRSSNVGSSGLYIMISTVFQGIFMALANIVVMWFSRHREYYADAGAADLVGAPKMIAALKRLRDGRPTNEALPPAIKAFGISGSKKDSLSSTHPTLDNRIEALEKRTYRV